MMRREDISAANRVRPDYIGFVFAEDSRRRISSDTAYELSGELSDAIPTIGVFRDNPIENVLEISEKVMLDAVQLHGTESNRFIRMLRSYSDMTIVKAFAGITPEKLEEAYASEADMILLDSGAGTGKTFDWDLLLDFDREYILAGGLNPENVGEAIKRLHPMVVDTSSGIESDGIKDENKMIQFKKAVETADSL